MSAVAPWRIQLARDHGVAHADLIAVAARKVGIPFWAAVPIAMQESADPSHKITGGANVYGHDKGGALSGFPLEVNEGNWQVLRWLVIDKGQISNGFGPMQITYAGKVLPNGKREGGYITQMERLGLNPWEPLDNLTFGLGLFWGNYVKHSGESWRIAASIYNGGGSWASNPKAVEYGNEVLGRIRAWHNLCKAKGSLNPPNPELLWDPSRAVA